MTKHTKSPKGVTRVTEYEIDPRDIEDMLRGKRRRTPRPPVSVKHHDISSSDFEKFLRRIGGNNPDNGAQDNE